MFCIVLHCIVIFMSAHNAPHTHTLFITLHSVAVRISFTHSLNSQALSSIDTIKKCIFIILSEIHTIIVIVMLYGFHFTREKNDRNGSIFGEWDRKSHRATAKRMRHHQLIPNSISSFHML